MGKDANKRLYTEAEVQRLIATAIDQATFPLLERIDQFELQIARMRKDSSNYSKTPSSDIVKPKATKPKGKRKAGGQKGHPRNVREPFPPEQVDRTYIYELDDITGLELLDQLRVVQQVELPEKLLPVTEHRARRYRCIRTVIFPKDAGQSNTQLRPSSAKADSQDVRTDPSEGSDGSITLQKGTGKDTRHHHRPDPPRPGSPRIAKDQEAV